MLGAKIAIALKTRPFSIRTSGGFYRLDTLESISEWVHWEVLE
jgi:hypothetical protein